VAGLVASVLAAAGTSTPPPLIDVAADTGGIESEILMKSYPVMIASPPASIHP
jgi:hypothetical protein